MTSRDIEIIEFLNKYKVATTSILSHFFFSSIHSCYKVLNRLVKNRYIKRVRLVNDSINCEYVYYTKKIPDHFKHALTLITFYYKWDLKYKNVGYFEIEKKYDDIIPDALMEQDGKLYFVEIELSNKGFNYMKYEKFYITEEYKKYFDIMPDVIICGKGNIKIPLNTRVNYKIVELNIYG